MMLEKKVKVNDMSRKLTGYKKYQLEWMIEHGYSLEDLMLRMDDIVDDLYHRSDRPLPSEAMEEFEELGFKQSEIWACEDDWEQNEDQEENDKENICPVCGHEIEYDFDEQEQYGVYEGVYAPWKCEKCGSNGTVNYKGVFNYHDVDENGLE